MPTRQPKRPEYEVGNKVLHKAVKKAGGETSNRAVKTPSDIGGELHRLGAGKKHAKVQRMEEALFRNPPPLVDEHAMHQRDLTRGAAQGQNADPGPQRERFGKTRLL